ncbi:MAG: metallopeptidase family protein [Sphingomonadaceae bacterium]|nr:metallopeptidase family protein [Sphingomonadaceae bacterium]
MAGTGQIAPDAAEIERLARTAIARLPDVFRAHLGGILLIVEEFAENRILDEMDIDDPFALSGLYSGRPVGEPRQTGDPPATIHLYRRAILDEWIEGGEALDHLVAHVLVHEVGHHFGLSDTQMHALEDAAG